MLRLVLELNDTTSDARSAVEFDINYDGPRGKLVDKSAFAAAMLDGYLSFVDKEAKKVLDMRKAVDKQSYLDSLKTKIGHLEFVEEDSHGSDPAFIGGVAVLKGIATCPHGHEHPYLIYGSFAIDYNPNSRDNEPDDLAAMIEKALGIKVQRIN